ncbi:Aldehyde, CO, or xanthine dehydrogenase, FAD-binding subunit [Cupriavidus necator]|uniref:4-Hydroxybenzoyl-CoA reductase, FAD-binding subunit B n=1 Tax=Cupriavidus necator (strain ATCC 17699 / DSM 428 / KCTC 22496 / NCIMB 10442 / H16 / Stanier 337) TaxID=381666 RepID=Q0K383_CUPNH|nr:MULTISPECIES: xanthine dehydrogenase family protein subunit M [Cupriavidus]EON19061.1 4-hydroxybenzoyl-CoA reductase FAD-binding subunit B [Cupriavidus sp. GA3-3]QCC03440.1 xanthine dehydrogenase family protein subunit M [Cupriavidus necator H16]QQB80496.1 xanthine dehydrogenase family protein subunit M [Cupriavidus necator]WKA44778.1 xanthine dehydrogenase family protein subunit M [Cupriavidus necator]CAJ95541.1 4-Hydroxybenzoyl-CoA reductase, FAD-binding subunit B [Cupriavidus necator H16
MRDFAFLEPATVAEASQMLAELGDSCRILAGGTALMLGMRQRMLTPGHLVSLGRLKALRGITFDAREGLRIGALTLHAEVARSPLVQAHYPMLASMASRVANPQVRNQGTIGGNLCYADPATDPPGCLMALGARIVVSGRGGEREIDIEDFLVDYYVTALAPDEIVTQIRVPAPGAGADGRYARFLRTAAEHRPLASVALAVRREGAFCVEARLAVGASTPIPARLRRAEALLAGKAVTAELAEETAAIVAADINAVSDMRGSESYRREMVRVVARRTIAELFGVASE